MNLNGFGYYLDHKSYEETLRSKDYEQSLIVMHSCKVRKRRKAVG